MAINYELLNKGGISLGTNFELLSEKPLDSRLVVPSLNGLQNYIDNAAAYEGMIVYVSGEKKHYEVKTIDGVLSYRPFGLTEAELNDIITNATTAAMEFKGAAATLPENPAKGDMYKVAGENINIKIDDVDAKLGDSIVYDGEKWFLIPSGDDIEDTWRPVDGVNNDATLKFVDGDKTVAAVAADGTIKYNHATVATPVDVTAEGDEKTRTYITAVETDGYGHITGYKTATENVEDTNTEYTFESQVESSSVYFQVTPNTEGATEETIYVDTYSKNEADGKFVEKETGKSLISDDEIARLAEVDNYDDEEVRGLINAIDNHSHENKAVLDGITSTKVSDWDDAVAKEHTHTFVDSDVEDAISKKHSHTFTDEDVVDAISKKHAHTFVDADVDDAISKKHSHTFVEAELNKIADGDVEKWNAAEQNAKDYADDQIEKLALGTMSKETADDYVKKSDATGYGDILTKTEAQGVYQAKGDYAAEEHTHTKNEITDFAHTHTASEVTDLDATIKGYDYATKTELQNVDKKFANYVTSEAYGVDKEAIETAIGNIYTKTEADEKFITGAVSLPAPDASAQFCIWPTSAVRIWMTGDTTGNTSITSMAGWILQVDELPEKGLTLTDGEAAVLYFYQLTSDLGTNKIYTYFSGQWSEFSLDQPFVSYSELISAANGDGAMRYQILNKFVSLPHVLTESGWMPVGYDGAGVEADNFLRFAEREYTYTKEETDTAVQGAKDYAKGLVDAIPAQTDYTVTITETTDGLDTGIAKKYTFTQNGAEIGSINLAKELVVTSGTVKEVTVADTPYAGAVVGDKYIELVIANQTAPIYIPAKDLVDIYTAKELTTDSADEVKIAISNTNEISATLVNGKIAKSKLAADVQTSLGRADTALQEHQDISHLAKTEDLGDLAMLDAITADKVTNFATEVAKVKVNEAVKATQDGNGDVIVDTYAKKATTLAGYGIGDAYTKDEVIAMLTWGEF